MKLQDLIQEYKEKSKSDDRNDQYSALLFALQLPSICSRIEFPQTAENTGKLEDGKLYKNNGRPWDGNLYKEWMKHHSCSFIDLYTDNLPLNKFIDAVYDLRCQLTHQGIVTSTKNKFYFIHKGQGSMFIDGITFLPIKRFCDDMFSAADNNRSVVYTNMTLSEDMILSDDAYAKIQQDVYDTYKHFWDGRGNDDNTLYILYEAIINDRPDNQRMIETFFIQNPDEKYEIWDFEYKYRIMLPDNKYLFEEYDEDKSVYSRDLKANTLVCRFSKSDYERMLKIVSDLQEYSKLHPFNIIKYL